MDLKLFGKPMQELDSLMQTVRRFSSDIGMQFGICECGMVEMKRGKVVLSKGIELANRETIKMKRDLSIWVCYSLIL